MPESDVFALAYGRLSATRLTESGPPAATAAVAKAAGEPLPMSRSRLLPRLALMEPKKVRLRPTWHLD